MHRSEPVRQLRGHVHMMKRCSRRLRDTPHAAVVRGAEAHRDQRRRVLPRPMTVYHSSRKGGTMA